MWHTWLLGLSAVIIAALSATAGVIVVGLPLFAVGLIVAVPAWAFDAGATAGAIIVGPYLFARHYLLVPEATQQLRDNIRALTPKAD